MPIEKMLEIKKAPEGSIHVFCNRTLSHMVSSSDQELKYRNTNTSIETKAKAKNTKATGLAIASKSDEETDDAEREDGRIDEMLLG